jgi:hypothetical protein
MTDITPEQKLKLFIEHRPWEDEPDEALWTDEVTGYQCNIYRHPTLKHLNGYVGIPRSHPMCGQDYNEINHYVIVHGGLTYAHFDKDEVTYWVGFDCSHALDLSPGLVLNLLQVHEYDYEGLTRSIHLDTYRDWGYVDVEVRKLARQLFDLEVKEN